MCQKLFFVMLIHGQQSASVDASLYLVFVAFAVDLQPCGQ